jgi:hypothetical protein
MRKRAKRKPESRRARALRESVKYSARDCELDPPADMDVFRLALARRIYTSMGEPRRCGERVCRRMKRCAGPDLRCARDFPAPPSTPEAWARVQAQIKRAVEARMAELEA